jgi:exodeoxyribonuclease VII large subunit
VLSSSQMPELAVSDFVALLNQTLDYAYPEVSIVGELANFRVSRERWVYFDLKDEQASLKFFGSVYRLPGPLEEGMMLSVVAQPRLHPLYGFSMNIVSIRPVGEGSIKRAALLLQAKLEKEGLFDQSRKRVLVYPPQHIGLITAKNSAAYADFMKILNARWRGVEITFIDSLVQGIEAPEKLANAIGLLNQQVKLPQVLVMIRGGGSSDDLAAFNSEIVTRAVALSRIPTLVAIGHEIDLSLAELAADQRASTPSNAAEILVPTMKQAKDELKQAKVNLAQYCYQSIYSARLNLEYVSKDLEQTGRSVIERARQNISSARELLGVLNPEFVLKKGYAIVRKQGSVVRDIKQLNPDELLIVQLSKGDFSAKVLSIKGGGSG